MASLRSQETTTPGSGRASGSASTVSTTAWRVEGRAVRGGIAAHQFRRVELVDEPRVVAQLCGLERRTAWGGRDSIDHGPGGHDDLANAVAGALVAAAEAPRLPQIRMTAIRVPLRRATRWTEL